MYVKILRIDIRQREIGFTTSTHKKKKEQVILTDQMKRR